MKKVIFTAALFALSCAYAEPLSGLNCVRSLFFNSPLAAKVNGTEIYSQGHYLAFANNNGMSFLHTYVVKQEAYSARKSSFSFQIVTGIGNREVIEVQYKSAGEEAVLESAKVGSWSRWNPLAIGKGKAERLLNTKREPGMNLFLEILNDQLYAVATGQVRSFNEKYDLQNVHREKSRDLVSDIKYKNGIAWKRVLDFKAALKEKMENGDITAAEYQKILAPFEAELDATSKLLEKLKKAGVQSMITPYLPAEVVNVGEKMRLNCLPFTEQEDLSLRNSGLSRFNVSAYGMINGQVFNHIGEFDKAIDQLRLREVLEFKR